METDLFDFAYIPDWYGQLEELEGMVLPEPWQFKRPSIETKNQDTPILEDIYISFFVSKVLIIIQRRRRRRQQSIFI